jgi:CDP-glycerol glycerophosphotransferase
MLVFDCSIGRNYTGNPRAIYEYMVEQGLDKKYRCIWLFENPKTKIPGLAKVVKFRRIRYFYYMAVAGVWIFDCRQPDFLVKRKEAHYIQTWHGTPLKKLALDMETVDMGGETDLLEYKKHFKKNTLTWDYLLSQNPFSTEIFRRCFDFHKEILEIGYPRNDILFQKNTKEYQDRLKTELSLPKDKKVILYAPTWRDNEFYESGQYKFTPALDFSLLKERLSKEYILLVKYHYLIQDKVDWQAYEGFLYKFNAEYDISELYLLADMLITDYSSVMFDYSILKRPMLFYCYDYENYQKNLRGFYFDFAKEAPGPISKTTQELINDILEKNYLNYSLQYEAFCRKFNEKEDGSASRRVVELIESFGK